MTMVATITSSVSGTVVEHDGEGPAVGAHHPVQHALDQPVEPGGVRARRLADEMRADHRRQRQRHDGRDHDGEGKRHGELAEHPADDAAHEQQRDEGRDQRNADRHHREADLARAFDRGASAATCPFRDCGSSSRSSRSRRRPRSRPRRRAPSARGCRSRSPRPTSPRRCRRARAAPSRRPRSWRPRAAGTRTPPASPGTTVASSVNCMSWTLARIVPVRSDSTEMSMPAGIQRLSSGSSS